MTGPGIEMEDDASREARLIERAQAGNQQAFAELVRSHERLVFKIAGGFLRGRADVEEVAQDAFLRAFAALSGFRRGARFGPWIAQITTRLCYDRLRQRQVRREVGWDDLAPGEQQAVQALAGRADSPGQLAERDLAERALAALGAKERQVLMLCDGLGHTAAEAAAMMGSTPVAIRVRLHRARRAMRAVVEELLRGASEKE